MKVAVIGSGYVGLTTGACLAHLGHEVVCADVIEERVDALNRGEIPIVEDGLEEIVREGLDSGRLRFVMGAATAAPEAEFIFLCVPTPQAPDGSADMSYIEQAAAEVGPVLESESVVINKSTVPVGSARVVERALGRSDVFVVSNPEFLREGSAVHDFLHPDRIVIGADDQAAAIRVTELFTGIKTPFVVTDPATAETIKYASNAFLATKVSYINAVANLCEAVGANVREVVLGMGYDKRIGFEFLRPGPGWGGSCFLPDETVLACRRGRTRLLRFDELLERVEEEGSDGWEILAWVPEEPGPDFLPVSSFTARPWDGEVVEVRTKMGRHVVVTPDHPFVVGDGTGPHPTAVRPAGELGAGDWLPVATGLPLYTDPLPWCGRPLEGLEPAGIPGDETDVPGEFELTDAFWRVLGLYLAEGSVTSEAGRAGSVRQRIAWHFHPTDEDDPVRFVADFWADLGVKASVHQRATSRVVTVSSRILAGWWLHVLGVGRDCYTHRVPDLVWGASLSAKRALLRGLWDGDGSWSFVNGGPGVVLECGTVSRALADGVLRLLGELGVVARLKVGRTAKSTVDTYWITISGADQVEGCLWLLPDDEADTVSRSLAAPAKRIRPTGYRQLGKNAAWVRVTSTARRRYRGPVYSVEVPAAGTVVTTGGLVAHNCFPKDTRALVHIAETAGYDFGLLKGVIGVNEEQYERVMGKVVRMAGGSVDGETIAAWGLTFKARTDDLRESPALAIIRRLADMGAKVRAYDPTVRRPLPDVETVADPYDACDDASVLVVLTEWDEFRWLDLGVVRTRMAQPRIVDARNLLEPAAARRAGFRYDGVGLP